MHPVFHAAILVAVLAFCQAAARAETPSPFERFCPVPPFDAPCAALPFDQTDFDSSFEYMNLEKSAQDPFDYFAWQAFTALNWPAAGGPLGAAPDRPRVWQAFARPDDVFGGDGDDCAADGAAALTIRDLLQSDGNALVDRDGNFVVFDTRMNGTAADYIRRSGLDTAAGQAATGDAPVAFPMGGYAGDAHGDSTPSVLLKTAWRVFPKDAVPAGYLIRPGAVRVPAGSSIDGRARCLTVTLGLVGMHIVMRTRSGNGDEWIWATFEHAANAPVAANARNVNSIYADVLFPDGCTPPAESAREYAFFDPGCPDCATNRPPPSGMRWAARAPYAVRADGTPPPAPRVVRCWDIFESTAAANAAWRAKLAGTVLADYMLVSTQWRGAAKSPLFEHGEVPRFLTNTTLETYLQYDRTGTCLGCHASAETTAGRPANFTFLLRRAR